MEYFGITKDYDNFPKVFMQGLIPLQNYSLILKGHTYLLPKSMTLSASMTKREGYTDILTEQIFMINEKMFNLLKLFDEDIDYRCMFLSNEETSYFYYIPILPLVDCYSDQSKANLDKSAIETLILTRNKYFPDVFRIAHIKENITIVSEVVMKAVLRRDIVGIRFEKIEFEGEAN